MRRGIFEQQPVVLSGDNAADEVIQDMEFWSDTGGARAMLIATTVYHVTASCELYLETAARESGPWDSVTISATGDDLTVFEASSAATNKLRRFVRWRVVGGAINWEISFSAKGTVKA